MAEVVAPPTVLPRKLATKALVANPVSRYEKDASIPRNDYLSQHQLNDVRTLRAMNRIIEALRKLVEVDGTVSTAVFNLVQVANSDITLRAYDSTTHTFSQDGTMLAQSVVASFDTLFDYTLGYADKPSMGSLVETMLREATIAGSVAVELVLNKARLPDRLSVIPAETLSFKSRGDGTKYPVQQQTSGEVPLDMPTIWISDSHKDASRVYALPMLQSALNATFYYDEFVEDMRRTLRRSGHSRLVVTLNAEKVVAAAPQEVRQDQDKLKSWLELTREQVETVVKALEPDDALVTYDTVETDTITAAGEKADYRELLQTLSGLLATSLKTHPSILGLRLTGSQSLSNTESLVFLKVAAALQVPVESVLSRALTLACRLYGSDVYVKVQFKPINLRPDDELEAFMTMRQARILEQLSLGFIDDDEAARRLGVWPRPPGAPPLMGTMFHKNSSQSKAEEATPNDDPMGRSLQPDTPPKAGGESQ